MTNVVPLIAALSLRLCAVMLYAHAATKVLLEGGNLYDGLAVTEAVRSTRFEGIAGVVALNQQGDRIDSYEVMNYVLMEDGKVDSVPVGVYHSNLQQYKAYERAVVWPGSMTEVPSDSGALLVTLPGMSHHPVFVNP